MKSNFDIFWQNLKLLIMIELHQKWIEFYENEQKDFWKLDETKIWNILKF